MLAETPVTQHRSCYSLLHWRLILHCCMLYCRILSGTQEKCSAVRKRNNKHRQVSMFLLLLFNCHLSHLSSLLSLFPLSLSSLCSLSQFSLLPFLISPSHSTIPFFIFLSILCRPKIKTSKFHPDSLRRQSPLA